MRTLVKLYNLFGPAVVSFLCFVLLIMFLSTWFWDDDPNKADLLRDWRGPSEFTPIAEDWQDIPKTRNNF